MTTPDQERLHNDVWDVTIGLDPESLSDMLDRNIAEPSESDVDARPLEWFEDVGMVAAQLIDGDFLWRFVRQCVDEAVAETEADTS